MITHNTHKKQISMPPEGFEPTISAREGPQTYALGRTTTGQFSTKELKNRQIIQLANTRQDLE